MHKNSIIIVFFALLFSFLSVNAQDNKNLQAPAKYFINESAGEIKELMIALPDKSTSPEELFNSLKKLVGKGSKGEFNNTMLVVLNSHIITKPDTFEQFEKKQPSERKDSCCESQNICFHRALNEIQAKYNCKDAPINVFAMFNSSLEIVKIIKNHKFQLNRLIMLAPPVANPQFIETFTEITQTLPSPSEISVYFTMRDAETVLNFSKNLNAWEANTKIYAADIASKSVFYFINEIFKPEKRKKQFRAQIPQPEVEIKIFDTKNKKVISYEYMILQLIENDVIFFGEQHDSIETHRLEQNVLTGLYSQRKKIAVSLEMFERDVQGILDNYLSGKITEREFLRTSRPWGNYFTGYKALIEFAKAYKLPVIAANVPRKYASMISRQGVESLETLSKEERAYCARELKILEGDYKDRFFDVMKKMGAPGHSKMLDSMFAAQCLKDDTMAESIHYFLETNKNTLTIHYNGAFHSDFGLGTAEKLALLNPKLKIAVLTAIPVQDLNSVTFEQIQDMADFVVLIKLNSYAEDF